MSESATIADLAVDDLAPPDRDALRGLILVLADSKRLLGIRYADWVLGAPELEACIAASSLAQDEWGHARILYALLRDFGDDPGSIEHEREAAEYRNIEVLDRPLDSWQAFVVANAIVDTALTTQLESLTGSRYASLRQRVRKQLDEEHFHFAHGAAWLRRLGRSADEARSTVKEVLDRAWPIVLHWFGPDDHGSTLEAAGLADATGGELRERFLGRVRPMLDAANIEPPDVDLDFADWNPGARRFSRTGPDEDALARARGDRNRAFLMD